MLMDSECVIVCVLPSTNVTRDLIPGFDAICGLSLLVLYFALVLLEWT